MKFVRIVPFLLLTAFSASSLFAQGGGNTGGGTGVSVESDFMGVENVAALGGFIGGGSPNAFVGRDEIYRSGSSSRSTRTTNTSRLAATTTARTRTAVTSTAQRQAGGGFGTSPFGSNNQSIRSTTSLDSDMGSPSVQRLSPALETQLARLQGIQGSQVALTGSTAVLTGTVASNTERRVAQQLLLLQPGINRVDNRLEVR